MIYEKEAYILYIDKNILGGWWKMSDFIIAVGILLVVILDVSLVIG
jgi:hypothetical protein